MFGSILGNYLAKALSGGDALHGTDGSRLINVDSIHYRGFYPLLLPKEDWLDGGYAYRNLTLKSNTDQM